MARCQVKGKLNLRRQNIMDRCSRQMLSLSHGRYSYRGWKRFKRRYMKLLKAYHKAAERKDLLN